MKTISSVVLLLAVSCLGIKAQKPIAVVEDSLKFGKSTLPGLSVIIPEVDYEKTQKVWTRDLQSGTKSKVVTENGDNSIFGARIKELYPEPINIYFRLTNPDSAVQLVVSFEIKKDEYIERKTREAEFVKAQKYLKEFAKNLYIDVVKDQLNAEDKKLNSLQKDLSSLENDLSRLQKSIQSNNSTISSEKGDIIIQKNEFETVSAGLVEQNRQLSSMEVGPAQKEKMNSIKELEKRKKKALNSIESSEKKINKANTEIENANNEIPHNKLNQDKVREQIVQQEIVCQKFTDKLKKVESY